MSFDSPKGSNQLTLYFHFLSVGLVVVTLVLYAMWFVLFQKLVEVYIVSSNVEELQKIALPSALEQAQVVADSFNKNRSDTDLPPINSDAMKAELKKTFVSTLPKVQFIVFLSLIAHFPIYFFWGKRIILESRLFGASVKEGSIYPYPKKRESAVVTMVADLCHKMRIDPDAVEIMTTQRRCAPFVIRWNKAYHLVVPIVALSSAEEAKSLIAHELAHIQQHDASMGRWCRIVSTATHRLIFLDYLVSCVGLTAINLAYAGIDSPLTRQMGLILYLLFFFSYVFIKVSIFTGVNLVPYFLARFFFIRILYRSEYLADRTAVSLSEKDALASALLKFTVDDEEHKYSRTHPSLTKRLGKINKTRNFSSISLNLGR